MAEGRWADWQVREIAENLAEKCPKRDWFSGDDEKLSYIAQELVTHYSQTVVFYGTGRASVDYLYTSFRY